MNGTSDIKIEDHHTHEKDNIKVIRDFDFLSKMHQNTLYVAQQKCCNKIFAVVKT